MSQKFEPGDYVIVRIDEGLDTPREARGKTGTVVEYLGDLQYTVKMLGGDEWCACEYHLIKLPRIKKFPTTDEMTKAILTLDPDLHEHVEEMRTYVPELCEVSLTTTLLVMAWVGYQTLQENPRYLRGSGIHEVVK